MSGDKQTKLPAINVFIKPSIRKYELRKLFPHLYVYLFRTNQFYNLYIIYWK